MRSFTVMSISWMAGKERTGTAFFLSAAMVFATQVRMFIACPLYAANSAASSAAAFAAWPASSV